MSTNLLSSLYEHLGELGAGTYGIVTKARSKKVKNRLVALKRIMVKAQDARNNNGINFTDFLVFYNSIIKIRFKR